MRLQGIVCTTCACKNEVESRTPMKCTILVIVIVLIIVIVIVIKIAIIIVTVIVMVALRSPVASRVAT